MAQATGVIISIKTFTTIARTLAGSTAEANWRLHFFFTYQSLALELSCWLKTALRAATLVVFRCSVERSGPSANVGQ